MSQTDKPKTRQQNIDVSKLPRVWLGHSENERKDVRSQIEVSHATNLNKDESVT
jgi:hypothetical protein